MFEYLLVGFLGFLLGCVVVGNLSEKTSLTLPLSAAVWVAENHRWLEDSDPDGLLKYAADQRSSVIAYLLLRDRERTIGTGSRLLLERPDLEPTHWHRESKAVLERAYRLDREVKADEH